MEPEKEKWIDDVLSSADGLQRAEPGPFLFASIRNRLTDRAVPVRLPMRTVWLAAASFGLLVVLNWQAASGRFASAPANASELNTVVTDLNLYPATNQLYDVWSGPNY
ncbi:hypothetical protein GGR92_004142 [Spirosoma lacussanchae]|uniref:hypothetical protein n=1 Tax=Spirosoma lacussanchae TaxID=1884249 RepID=UPI00110980EC|nr:hypothetical protein [Spirosoma lacussanchae]